MNVLDNYSSFMVFELKDSGEKERLNITEQELSQDNGNKILHDSQVVLIVKEDLRKIYIWKGHQSTVRKKFIASRVAQDLQQELTYLANFHRCKIVSIDQGEEPFEFLNTFGLMIQKIPEKEDVNQPQLTSFNISNHQTQSELYKKPAYIKTKPSKEFRSIPYKSNKDALTRVLQINTPVGYKRNYILIGKNNLYGIIIKKTEIFNKPIEESEWGPIKGLPNKIIELDGHKLRIHFNNKLNIIEAIEILEKITSEMNEEKSKQAIDYKTWTVKQLKVYCAENHITVPSAYRKAQIINLIKEFHESKEYK